MKITCRLVPGQDPNKVLKAIEGFVRERLPKDCRAEFSGSARHRAIAFDTEHRTSGARRRRWRRSGAARRR